MFGPVQKENQDLKRQNAFVSLDYVSTLSDQKLQVPWLMRSRVLFLHTADSASEPHPRRTQTGGGRHEARGRERREAGGRRQEAGERRETAGRRVGDAEGGRREAGGDRRKAVGRRRKVEGGKREARDGRREQPFRAGA